jgi:heavy metal sensor kinase
MKIFSSTKIRLTFWYVGVLALILILFAAATYFLFDSVLRYQTDSTLAEIATSFENTAYRELEDEDIKNNKEKVGDAIRDATVEVSFKNYKLFVFSSDKTLLSETETTKLDTDIPSETAQKWLAGFTQNGSASMNDYTNNDETFRVYYHSFKINEKDFYLLVVHPLEESEDLLEKVRYAFLITVPLALIFASLGGYLLVRKSLAPIAEMSEKAEEITARNLHERLPVENEEDELGRLARTFNRLLARLNLSFEQQQRFMADASHELRTPVSIVRGEAEVSLTKDNRKSSEYRETIEIMQKEAERMSRIIEDLFTLARADAGENPLQKHSIYLEDILNDTVKAFRSIASKRGIDLSLETKNEMPMKADEQMLKRLFANLIDNAIKHTKTKVNIIASLENGTYKIDFSDDGEGIAVEDQTQIFERFYRVDKARSRQKEATVGSGAGLGLSISKWISEIHNGTLELTKSDLHGSVFSVTFPQSQ